MQRTGPLTWRLEASTEGVSGTVLTWWVDGMQAQQGPGKVLMLTVEEGETPVVEVSDDEAQAGPAEEAWPSRMLLSWDGMTEAAGGGYFVEEFSGGDWVMRARIKHAAEQDGRGWFSFRTRALTDGQVHQFGVTAYDAAGNRGTRRVFSALMVRHPDPPAASFEYDEESGELTVSAA